MTYWIGRFLQMAGMILLPAGLYIGLARDDVRTEVRYLAAGGIIYLIGWLLSRKPEK